MRWSECCGCAMAFYAACQRHMMVHYCCGSGSTMVDDDGSTMVAMVEIK